MTELLKLKEEHKGPYDKEDWLSYAKDCVKSGLYYARKIFIDVHIENSARRSYKVNKYLHAANTFIGAEVFNPTCCNKMILRKVKAYLDLLINFNFISKEMTENTKNDINRMHAYMKRNCTLPYVSMLGHKETAKSNEIKNGVNTRKDPGKETWQ